MPSRTPQPPARNRSPRRAGFSFTEILFAVVILGIGFIMVAAIFPVAIEQGKATNEQTVAAAVGRNALSVIGQVADNSDENPNSTGGPLFPATGVVAAGSNSAQITGNVWSLKDRSAILTPIPTNFPQLNNATFSGATIVADQLWNRISQSVIVPNINQYAFVGMYRRDGDPLHRSTWSSFAQVWFIPVTTRSRGIYGAVAGTNNDTAGAFNLVSRLVQVEITDPSSRFSTSPTGGYVLRNYVNAGGGYTPAALTNGCYVIIARDNIITPFITNAGINTIVDAGRMNGHVYHVGLRRPELDGTNSTGAYQTYDLQPDGDFVPDAGADNIFGATNPNTTPPADDDILAIGNTAAVGASAVTTSAPADAYIVGEDISNGTATGSAQDISAFTTFIKVD